MRNSVHHDFDRNCNLLFHLLSRAARPLRNDVDVVVGHVRIRFDGQIGKRNGAPDQQEDGRQHDQKAVGEREIDDGADHLLLLIIYCSAVFWSTSASLTTESPGATPEITSCKFGGSIFPLVTSTL